MQALAIETMPQTNTPPNTNSRGRMVAQCLCDRIRRHCQEPLVVEKADTMVANGEPAIVVECKPKIIDVSDIYNKKFIPDNVNEVINELKRTHKITIHDDGIEVRDFMTYLIKIKFKD